MDCWWWHIVYIHNVSPSTAHIIPLPGQKPWAERKTKCILDVFTGEKVFFLSSHEWISLISVDKILQAFFLMELTCQNVTNLIFHKLLIQYDIVSAYLCLGVTARVSQVVLTTILQDLRKCIHIYFRLFHVFWDNEIFYKIKLRCFFIVLLPFSIWNLNILTQKKKPFALWRFCSHRYHRKCHLRYCKYVKSALMI